MTSPNPSPSPTDPSLIHEAFYHLMGHDSPILGVSRLTNSFGHECWKITTTDRTCLLKIAGRKGSLYHFQSEMRACELAQDGGIPAPTILAKCPAPNVLGRNYYIQEWLDGEDAETALPNMTPEQRVAFAYDLGRAVGQLHTIEGDCFSEDAHGEIRFPSWQTFCQDRLNRLGVDIRESHSLPEEKLGAAEKKCRSLIEALPTDIRPALTHRDLYFPNFLVTDGQFRALLDFEIAKFYDPLYDLPKLNDTEFRTKPDMYEPFYRGYHEVIPWQEDFPLRISLSEGLLYLSAVHYFHARYLTPDMLELYLVLLDEWLEKDARGKT
ncbi:phosphotransferase family protein [Brevibacillus dissolubilis]|uniref:phosphotransferase family protein n=1 Tax=Brevibacillus dissolubilis TaxID=1844116 RepID=UPI0011178A8D|nr:aminoglycoside phosphotransferase family protein [Brevibacillus dissolubilis]